MHKPVIPNTRPTRHLVTNMTGATVSSEFLKLHGVLFTVDSYEESLDAFGVTFHIEAPGKDQNFVIPALLMPYLTGTFGEPEEFVGRRYGLRQ